LKTDRVGKSKEAKKEDKEASKSLAQQEVKELTKADAP
jgi:hypothetical protein